MRSTSRSQSGTALPSTTWGIVLAVESPLRRRPQSSCLVRAMDRIASLVPASRTVVVASESQEALAGGLIVPTTHVVRQHEGTRAAVSVLAGLLRILALGERHAQLVILPAEGRVRDEAEWRASLARATAEATRARRLVLLGLQPEDGESGRGWIIPDSEDRGNIRRVWGLLESADALDAARLSAAGALVNSLTFAVPQDLLLELCVRSLWRAGASSIELTRDVLAGAPEVVVLRVPERRFARGAAIGNVFCEMN